MAATFGTLVVTAGVVAGLVRIPYDTVSPGRTYVVNDVLSVVGRETYPPEGEVLYATVSVRERVSVLQALIGWLDPTTDVIAEEKVRGDIPPEQFRQLNVEAMSDSKTAAEILALGRIGFTELGIGALVESIAAETPAAAVLKDKDLIVAIDGQTVRNTTDAVTRIRAHQPGETLQLRVRRDGAPTPLDLTADLARAEDGRALLGVRLSTKVELPFQIDIDSGEVVGPSAGLSYALELLDVLTPGELTGGVKVAATGELSPTGAVGPIGGIAQKVTTVKRAGAKIFIVPKANEAEARKHAGSVKIVGVANFDEALAALGSVQGSNALALARPAPGA